jgi:hypothetical protein
MKVCYVQSGGFVGALKSCEVNTAELGKQEAEQLEKMVRDSGLSQSASFRSEQARDLKQYEITIEDGSRAICVDFDDQNIPESARTLLVFLQKHAKSG